MCIRTVSPHASLQATYVTGYDISGGMYCTGMTAKCDALQYIVGVFILFRAYIHSMRALFDFTYLGTERSHSSSCLSDLNYEKNHYNRFRMLLGKPLLVIWKFFDFLILFRTPIQDVKVRVHIHSSHRPI